MRTSNLLVLVQFSCLALILYDGRLWTGDSLGQSLVWTGIILGVWSVVAMRPLNVSIFPQPKPDASLVQRGPYRYIRHPMYTAVIVFALGVALNSQDYGIWAVFTLLLFNQVLKLRFEERLLKARFPTYLGYMRSTDALVPLIY